MYTYTCIHTYRETCVVGMQRGEEGSRRVHCSNDMTQIAIADTFAVRRML